MRRSKPPQSTFVNRPIVGSTEKPAYMPKLVPSTLLPPKLVIPPISSNPGMSDLAVIDFSTDTTSGLGYYLL